MSRPTVLFASLFAVFGVLIVSTGNRLDAATPKASRAGLSGTWTLSEESGGGPFAVAEKASSESGGTGRSQGGGRGHRGQSGGGGSGGTSGGAMDAPLEAVGDARTLVIVDDGTKVQITYPTGRKRVFYTDGEERELDDGDGPAKVSAKRKGSGGAVIVVSSGWPEGRGLKETWELQSSPRRLVVEGSVKGRHSFSYKRVYEPAPEQPAPPPTGVASSSPATSMTPAVTAPAAVAPVPTPAVGRPEAVASGAKPECSLRPARGSSRAELARMAKITAAEAERRAVASVGSQKVSSVISSDLEVNDGCLVWPFDLRLPEKNGIQEVLIDAGDGKVISSSFESLEKRDTEPRYP